MPLTMENNVSQMAATATLAGPYSFHEIVHHHFAHSCTRFVKIFSTKVKFKSTEIQTTIQNFLKCIYFTSAHRHNTFQYNLTPNKTLNYNSQIRSGYSSGRVQVLALPRKPAFHICDNRLPQRRFLSAHEDSPFRYRPITAEGSA